MTISVPYGIMKMLEFNKKNPHLKVHNRIPTKYVRMMEQGHELVRPATKPKYVHLKRQVSTGPAKTYDQFITALDGQYKKVNDAFDADKLHLMEAENKKFLHFHYHSNNAIHDLTPEQQAEVRQKYEEFQRTFINS